MVLVDCYVYYAAGLDSFGEEDGGELNLDGTLARSLREIYMGGVNVPGKRV